MIGTQRFFYSFYYYMLKQFHNLKKKTFLLSDHLFSNQIVILILKIYIQINVEEENKFLPIYVI